MRRKALFITFGLLGFLTAGIYLETAFWTEAARSLLRSLSVPAAILNYGATGRAFRHLRLVRPVKNDEALYPLSDYRAPGLYASIFQKKRIVDQWLYTVNREWLPELSTFPVPLPDETPPVPPTAEWPVLAVRITPQDLTSDPWGIETNYKGHGREWERPAAITYFAAGQKPFMSLAGMRLHGGTSRAPGQKHSFRLYFREELGASAFEPGLGADRPVRHLVVHADWPPESPFSGLLSFDAAERMGCMVPATKPVRFFLNGKDQGLYFLSEQISRKEWVSRMGHPDFVMHIFKAEREREAHQQYGDFHRWVIRQPAPLLSETFEDIADLNNMIAYVFSMVYCGVSDGYQGAAIRDNREAVPKWRWINWDMDHGFVDVYGGTEPRDNWQQESWERAILHPGEPKYSHWRNRGDAPSVLFGRLVRDDPAFCRRAVRWVMDTLNHTLTHEFLSSRIDHYERLARSFGRTDLKFIEDYRNFIDHRPAFLRERMKDYFGVGDAFLCRVSAPANLPVVIDGLSTNSSYDGWYFEGESIGLSAPEEGRWLVNGIPLDEREVSLTVTQNLDIVWNQISNPDASIRISSAPRDGSVTAALRATR